jgi:hypothetical protein
MFESTTQDQSSDLARNVLQSVVARKWFGVKGMERVFDGRDIDKGSAEPGTHDRWTMDSRCLAEIPVCDFYSIQADLNEAAAAADACAYS